MTIVSSTISGNVARDGGGINSLSNVIVQSSTISDNVGTESGGGILALGTINEAGTVLVHSSTISGNSTGESLFFFAASVRRYGGGILAKDVLVAFSTITGNLGLGGGIRATRDATVENSIIAGNFTEAVLVDNFTSVDLGRPSDLSANSTGTTTIRSSLIGHSPVLPSIIGDRLETSLTEAPLSSPDENGNLIGGPIGGAIDPRLGPLSDNGGPTLTHPLLSDSPAIDAGDPSLVADISAFDQRGEPYQRIERGRADMGAYERHDPMATLVSIPSPTVQSVDAVTIEFTRPVTGFDVSDLTLRSRNTDGELLTGGERLSTTDNQTFVLSGLTKLTEVPGIYTPTLIASGSTIQAANGNPLKSSASTSWTMSRRGLTVDTLVDEVDGRIDDGDVSLRDALAFAVPGETITFDPSLDGGTLLLTLGELHVTRAVTVDATALNSGLVIDASGNDSTPNRDDGFGSRVFRIDDGTPFANSPVTLRGLVLTGGDVDSTGGAILAEEPLAIEETSVTGNSAKSGGGISAADELTIDSSTISGNSAESDGGGISASRKLTINSSTISGNSARWTGGILAFGELTINSSTISANTGRGVSASGELISLSNTIVAANRGAPDLDVVFDGHLRTLSVQHSLIGNWVSPFNNGGVVVTFPTAKPLSEAPFRSPDANGNLVGGPVGGAIDPRLGPLTDNGGRTLTHALLPDSPAINMGDPLATAGVNDIPTFDQRDALYSRVVGGRIDMGAFELGVAGDANGDDKVDFADFLILSAHFGTGQSWSEGNFDGSEDGTQFADFLALSANFGFDGSGNGLGQAGRIDRLFAQFA